MTRILDLTDAQYLSHEDRKIVEDFMLVYDRASEREEDYLLDEAMDEIHANHPHLWKIIDRLVLNRVLSGAS